MLVYIHALVSTIFFPPSFFPSNQTNLVQTNLMHVSLLKMIFVFHPLSLGELLKDNGLCLLLANIGNENYFCYPKNAGARPTKLPKCPCLWLVLQTPPKTPYIQATDVEKISFLQNYSFFLHPWLKP
jgi:hypothetical protein